MAQIMPSRLPSFLQPLEAAFVQAGLQLRMLQRMHPSAALTVDRTCASAAQEAAHVTCLLAENGQMENVVEIRPSAEGVASSMLASGPLSVPAYPLSFNSNKLLQVQSVFALTTNVFM